MSYLEDVEAEISEKLQCAHRISDVLDLKKFTLWIPTLYPKSRLLWYTVLDRGFVGIWELERRTEFEATQSRMIRLAPMSSTSIERVLKTHFRTKSEKAVYSATLFWGKSRKAVYVHDQPYRSWNWLWKQFTLMDMWKTWPHQNKFELFYSQCGKTKALTKDCCWKKT